jgi:membrane protein YdbS with pleckstrin-like domain
MGTMSSQGSNASSFNSVLHGNPSARSAQPGHTDGPQPPLGGGTPERVIARFRPHGRRLFFPSLLLMAVCGATGYFALSFPEGWQNLAVLVGAAVILVVGWLLPLLSWLASRYTVTTKRLIIRTGFVVSTRQEIPFNRGYDLAVRKSWLQSLFRSGDVRITRAPGQVAVLRDVPQADLVMTVIGDLLEDGVVWASAHRPVAGMGNGGFSGQNNTDPRGAYQNGSYPNSDYRGGRGPADPIEAHSDTQLHPTVQANSADQAGTDQRETATKRRGRRKSRRGNSSGDNDQTIVLPRQ